MSVLKTVTSTKIAVLYYPQTVYLAQNKSETMETEQTMDTLEKPFHFTPTVLQSAMGDPLRSE